MRIVLLGAAGQLAHDLGEQLADQELVPLAHADLDICDRERIWARLDELRPEVVVNTAAYNLVDKAESDPAEAFAVNALAVLHLARACGERNTTLVHFSTDYVFGLDSRRTSPWLETDAPGPISVYGASKLTGEYAIRAYCPKHLVIRTCGLYGHKGARGKGGNFVETMLRLGRTGNPVRVVNDQTCTPSFTHDVACASAALIRKGAQGLVHVTNAGSCTWFELAIEIYRQAGMRVDCQPITTAEFGAPARRPAYSVLDNQALMAAGVLPCPPWRDALSRYLRGRSAT